MEGIDLLPTPPQPPCQNMAHLRNAEAGNPVFVRTGASAVLVVQIWTEQAKQPQKSFYE